MFLKKLLGGWVFLISVLLIITKACSQFSPATFSFAYFFSLASPVLIAVNLFNLLLVLLYMRRLKSLFWIGLSLFIARGDIIATYQFSNDNRNIVEKPVRVMSYNVQVFNVYKHLRGKEDKNSKGILDWIEKQDVDILCLQEYYHNPESEFFNIVSFMKACGYPYFSQSISLKDRVNAFYGLAIFSKYPIINAEDVSVGIDLKRKVAHYVDILTKEDTLRLFNLHLESYADRHRFTQNDYDDTRRTIGYILSIVKKRALQADIIRDEVVKSPYPVILCGDFNSLPYEYPYQVMRDILNNAFEEKGQGFGFTRFGEPFPVRIDNQFFSDEIELKSFKTLDNLRYSDHVPIIGTYSWK